MFHGNLFYSYKLRWEITTGKETRHKDITVKFVLDRLFDSKAYPDTVILASDSIIQIAAKPLHKSLKCKWTVMSKTSLDSVYLSSYSLSTIIVRGKLAETYRLKYEIWNRNGTINKAATLRITFAYYTDTRVQDYTEKYRVVRIGTKIWMAENLRFYRGRYSSIDDPNTLLSLVSVSSVNYRYYNANDVYRKYGYYYNYEGVLLSSAQTGGPLVRIAPTGWHVADTSDWGKLVRYIRDAGDAGYEGKTLKSTAGWSNPGTDKYGFNALAGGYSYTRGDSVYDFGTQRRYYEYNGPFSRAIGDTASFWAATSTNQTVFTADNVVRTVQFTMNSDKLNFVNYTYGTTPRPPLRYYLPVRCVRDK